MKKISTVLMVAVLITAVFVTIGCQRSARGSNRTRTDTLIVAVGAMPSTLDPSISNDTASGLGIKQIYNSLIYLDENMTHVPSLAERWVFENDAQGNPTMVRFFLRRGVLFHNGDELKASDVKFSLDRARTSPVLGPIAGMIQSIEVINDYEVVVYMPYPFVPILNHLGLTGTSIFNERAFTELGQEAHALAPVGTGPYRVTNVLTGDRIEFTRWDQYWDTTARIPNLIIRAIADTATRQIELETGGVDISLDISPADLARNNEHPQIRLVRAPNLQTDYISFNIQKAPFNDRRVRLAINHAVDTEAMVNAAYLGMGSIATGPFTPAVWSSIAHRLQPYEFNQERARQLLREAGYPDGFSTSVWTNVETSQRIDIAEIMANMLGQVGIRVEIQAMEAGSYIQRTAAGEHDMFILGWVTSTGDPDYSMYPLFHTNSFGAGGNRSFYSNPQMDRLIMEAREETNLARREQIYVQLQEMVIDEAVWLPTWSGESVNAVRSDVQGFTVHPSFRHDLWTVYFE